MKITEYSLSLPGAPTLTLALVADLHCRPGEDALEMLQQLQPDLILSSGDMMQSCTKYRIDESFNLPSLTFLTKATQIAPVYLSIGNHEGGMLPENRELFDARHITLLDDCFVHEDHGLCIGGLTSPVRCGNKRTDPTPAPNLDFLQAYAAEPGFHLLLNHHPEFWRPHICGTGIQLTLSGHAHGGQWHLFGHDIWSPGQGLFPQYASGMHTAETGEVLVVSRGMTNTVPYAPRFGNPTEICVLRLSGNA